MDDRLSRVTYFGESVFRLCAGWYNWFSVRRRGVERLFGPVFFWVMLVPGRYRVFARYRSGFFGVLGGVLFCCSFVSVFVACRWFFYISGIGRMLILGRHCYAVYLWLIKGNFFRVVKRLSLITMWIVVCCLFWIFGLNFYVYYRLGMGFAFLGVLCFASGYVVVEGSGVRGDNC